MQTHHDVGRPPRSAEHLLIDLDRTGHQLHRLRGEQDRRSAALVQASGVSVMLLDLQAGTTVAQHAAPGPTTVHVLDGCVRFEFDTECLEASRGHLVAFGARVLHALHAIEESMLLLTIADSTEPIGCAGAQPTPAA